MIRSSPAASSTHKNVMLRATGLQHCLSIEVWSSFCRRTTGSGRLAAHQQTPPLTQRCRSRPARQNPPRQKPLRPRPPPRQRRQPPQPLPMSAPGSVRPSGPFQLSLAFCTLVRLPSHHPAHSFWKFPREFCRYCSCGELQCTHISISRSHNSMSAIISQSPASPVALGTGLLWPLSILQLSFLHS